MKFLFAKTRNLIELFLFFKKQFKNYGKKFSAVLLMEVRATAIVELRLARRIANEETYF